MTKLLRIPMIRFLYVVCRVRTKKRNYGLVRKMTEDEIILVNKQLIENNINLQL